MIPCTLKQIFKLNINFRTYCNEISSINQGARLWYQCYHSSKYPIVTFVHLDNASNIDEPIASSSFYEENNENFQNVPHQMNESFPMNQQRNETTKNEMSRSDFEPSGSFSVGHISHIPRSPPNAATFTIPSIIKTSIRSEKEDEDLFGMIKLKETDICYTSGTIEWVGRKRTFPLNTGFKIISDNYDSEHKTFIKRVKKDNTTLLHKVNKIRECDCADVLPTVNAIVDHLNALHEAVDLVDLRLNTLEDVAVHK